MAFFSGYFTWEVNALHVKADQGALRHGSGEFVHKADRREAARAVYADYKGRWSIEACNSYAKSGAGFNGLKLQGCHEQRGLEFIMLVTGIVHERLNRPLVLRSVNNCSPGAG